MFHTVPDGDFKKLKERTNQLLLNPQGVDKAIVPFLSAFNEIPGVTTVFSCSGGSSEGKSHKPRPTRFVTLVVTESGFRAIKALHDWMESLSVDAWRRYRPKLVAQRLRSKNTLSHYPVWVFQTNNLVNNQSDLDFTWRQAVESCRR